MISDEQMAGRLTQTKFSVSKGLSIIKVIDCMKKASQYFLSALEEHPKRGNLNENSLTQIFVSQLNNYLISKGFPFLAQTQYCDTYYETKGIPDFFFHKTELGHDSPAIFVVESKRLPSQTFEKEYVIGEKKNGGIERFKIGKHGKGQKECGLLGFIEGDDFKFWEKKVNNWIKEQSEQDSNWNTGELLTAKETKKSYVYLKSKAIKDSKPLADLQLHHLWVYCNFQNP